jgi:hypothetical protein
MNGSPDIILKLFDTLKDSTDKNERTMQTLIGQQQVLVESVTHMPINEIRQEVKDHIVSAHEERNGISKILNKVDSKITKMILVVVIVFTLFSSAVMIAKLSESPPTHQQLIEKIETLEKRLEKQ